MRVTIKIGLSTDNRISILQPFLFYHFLDTFTPISAFQSIVKPYSVILKKLSYVIISWVIKNHKYSSESESVLLLFYLYLHTRIRLFFQSNVSPFNPSSNPPFELEFYQNLFKNTNSYNVPFYFLHDKFSLFIGSFSQACQIPKSYVRHTPDVECYTI